MMRSVKQRDNECLCSACQFDRRKDRHISEAQAKLSAARRNE